MTQPIEIKVTRGPRLRRRSFELWVAEGADGISVILNTPPGTNAELGQAIEDLRRPVQLYWVVARAVGFAHLETVEDADGL